MFKNILVPYDNSEHAKHALEEALAIAAGVPGSEVHVAEVAAPPQDLVLARTALVSAHRQYRRKTLPRASKSATRATMKS